jgi:hypothetical protein
MNYLDHWADAVDQLAMFVPIVFERFFSISKQLEDIIRRRANLEFVAGGMFGEVYPGLFGIAVQCGIEDGLEVSRGNSCRRHDQNREIGWVTLKVEGKMGR